MMRTEHLPIARHIAIAAKYHGVRPADVTGESKAQKFVRPRKAVWLDLICETIGRRADGSPIYRSLPAIARHFSDRDHTTVLAGIRALSAQLYGTDARAPVAEIRAQHIAYLDSLTLDRVAA
jgi:chromosomal replication initiation ATPase DnaA